ncbi:MAG: S9 family peptidase [Bacteroidales bacterium]
MKLTNIVFYLFILLIIQSNSVFAQPKSTKLTLEDIFAKRVYAAKGINSLRWMKDNISYSTLENNKDVVGKDIVKYNVTNGERSVIVSAGELIKNDGNPIMIYNYSWSYDNSKLLLFTNTKKVWRNNTKGDYWVFDLKLKKLQQLGESMEPSTMMFAKFSPDGTQVAYVCKNNIYTEELDNSKITQLTTDGSNNIINGTFDWVYEEELHISDGFRWSPNSKYIAYWQFNTAGTGEFHIINNVDSIYSKVETFPYPKVGTTNSAAKVGVIAVDTKQTKWFNIDGDPRNNYIARMDFIPNSNEVIIQQLNRLQNTNKVYTANVETMMVNNILTDKDDAFVDIHDNIVWLQNEKYFTWTSEKDGWAHLYKVSRDGKTEQLITKGDFDVISISCIDTNGGYVYYLASPNSAIDKYLYRSRLDGKGIATRVTPQSFKGQNNYQLSSDAKFAVHNFHNACTPNQYSIINLPSHSTIKVMENNAALKERLNNVQMGKKEFFKVDINEAVLDGWIIKPTNFDSTKKYPVIVFIYGEPWSSTVLNSWIPNEMWSYYLAEQGYIIMSIDPRGTNMPKGREWRKSIYGKVGIVAPADHAKAMSQIISKHTYIDKERVGIWGWSGGGSMTLNAMFKYPQIYKTGIAVAFVSLQNLYDTIYQERYMGLPSSNLIGYRDGSPINFANNLQGNLMIIHGTGDDNVHYQSCEMLINKLVECNKIFSMMSYPMRTHSINERANTTLHLYRTMEKYWKENL